MARKLLVLLNVVLFAGSMVFLTGGNVATAAPKVQKCTACHDQQQVTHGVEGKHSKCLDCHTPHATP